MTRRTPRASAASSFLAEANPRSAAATCGARRKISMWRIKCRRPQRHVRWSGRMDRVRGDDLMLAFLNRHELAECRRLRDLALPNRFRVWLKDAQHLLGHVRVTAEQPRARLRKHARNQRLHLSQLLTGLDQRRRDRLRCGPET